MKTYRYLVGLAAASVVVSAGCASSADRAGSPSDASRPSAMSMLRMTPSTLAAADQTVPSASARMVCGPEIRQAVARALGLASTPAGTVTWSDELYTCTYQTHLGPVVLSVKDSTDAASGQAFFSSLRQRLTPTRPIVGLASLGLPAYETSRGTVVFLKDGKTLEVDATKLMSSAVREQSRADVAYALAADVIGCWNE